MGNGNKLTSIELFTGAGGLALGVAMAGFKHLAVIEWNHDACESLRRNKTEVPVMSRWPIVETDVREFDFKPYEGKVDLLGGGPPCQPFSLGGKHLGDKDDRNMFPQVFRALRELQAKTFLFENVKGLLRESFKPYFEYILLRLSMPEHEPKPKEDWTKHKKRLIDDQSRDRADLRYDVSFQLVNCADYGAPQSRHRVFITGVRSDLDRHWTRMRPSHSQDSLHHSKWVDGSYWRNHRMPRPEPPPQIKAALERDPLPLFKPREQRWQTVRDALRGLSKPKMGKESGAVANHVGIDGAKPYPGHTGSPLDEPAKALKAGDHGVPGGENMLVADDGSVRYFTVREAARLQTFPDEYVFCGSWTECMRQLGNAVPVTVGARMATAMRDTLRGNRARRQDTETAGAIAL